MGLSFRPRQGNVAVLLPICAAGEAAPSKEVLSMNRILVSTILLSVSLAQPAGATEAGQPWKQVLTLRPAPAQGPPIEFDYTFHNVLPPFEKEPTLEGKHIGRGLIPTFPPTRLLRNFPDGEIYLKPDHGQDFTTGPSATYKGQCKDGVHVIFEGLHVSTQQGALAIPYTVGVFTYRTVFTGRLTVCSGWSGTLERGGRSWRFTVIDNLDGRIDGQDRLHLADILPSPQASYHDCPVPQVLSLDGHSYHLDFTFKPAESNVILEAALTEVQLPMGELRIEAGECRALDLQDDRHLLLLSNPQGAVAMPAGNYRMSNCLLRSEGKPLQFVGCDRDISVPLGQITSLRVGLPLSNTIVATRDRNVLALTYQLAGAAGELYRCGGLRDLPSFRVYQGPFRIAGGSFGFG
jgi:hypothetical protein